MDKAQPQYFRLSGPPWDRRMQMSCIGAISGSGVNRACWTPLDRGARRALGQLVR